MQKTDKDRILNFLIGKEKANDFELWLYNNTDIESRIGSELYSELIDINYRDKFVLNNFSKVIIGNHISEEDFKQWKYLKTLEDSGWYKGRNTKVKIPIFHRVPSIKCATKIIREFGGLSFYYSDATDAEPFNLIEFNNTPICTDMSKYGLKKILAYFASAHNDHMYLYVDDNNNYYMDNIAGDKLYVYKGDNFEHLMKELLRIEDGDNFYAIG
ncbi:MAG: SUKH-3 domain-containing protein [Bacteroidales bacterium]|jgi:hypothetical protein|nr:SUKH-3 domain-containing protein [Bacteroidales bacterium]